MKNTTQCMVNPTFNALHPSESFPIIIWKFWEKTITANTTQEKNLFYFPSTNDDFPHKSFYEKTSHRQILSNRYSNYLTLEFMCSKKRKYVKLLPKGCLFLSFQATSKTATLFLFICIKVRFFKLEKHETPNRIASENGNFTWLRV